MISSSNCQIKQIILVISLTYLTFALVQHGAFLQASINIPTHMKKIFLYAAFLGAVISMGSCVSKKEFQQLQGDYTNLQGLYNQSQVDLATARTHGKSLEDRLADAQNPCCVQKSSVKKKPAHQPLSNFLPLYLYYLGELSVVKRMDNVSYALFISLFRHPKLANSPLSTKFFPIKPQKKASFRLFLALYAHF